MAVINNWLALFRQILGVLLHLVKKVSRLKGMFETPAC